MKRVQVWQPSTGCWEVICPCCLSGPVVAQVATWERAMLRAAKHVQEVHGE